MLTREGLSQTIDPLYLCFRKPSLSHPIMLPVSPGGLCYGRSCQPLRVPAAGDLPDLHRAAGHTADVVRLPPWIRQEEQGLHRVPVAPELVCPDCKGLSSRRNVITNHFSFQIWRDASLNICWRKCGVCVYREWVTWRKSVSCTEI